MGRRAEVVLYRISVVDGRASLRSYRQKWTELGLYLRRPRKLLRYFAVLALDSSAN